MVVTAQLAQALFLLKETYRFTDYIFRLKNFKDKPIDKITLKDLKIPIEAKRLKVKMILNFIIIGDIQKNLVQKKLTLEQ